MHHPAIALISSISSLSLSLATPYAFLARTADQSDAKCCNGQKAPCADSPLCLYDYAPFVENPRCQGGKPIWESCDVAIDIVCSTLAFNITASDYDSYESNIRTGQLEGQGTDCYTQASNGDGATSNLPYEICVQKRATMGLVTR